MEYFHNGKVHTLSLTDNFLFCAIDFTRRIVLMKLINVIAIALMFTISLAQSSGELRTCMEKAKTQLEMTVCASEEAKRTDVELNTTYQALLARTPGRSNVLAKIRASERAWIAYRDSYLEAMYPADDKQLQYGSSYSMEISLLTAKLTQQQIEALKDLSQQHTGSRQ